MARRMELALQLGETDPKPKRQMSTAYVWGQVLGEAR